MTHWFVIGVGVVLVAILVVLRRRLMDESGPGRLSDRDPVPWDGVDRRSDLADDEAPR